MYLWGVDMFDILYKYYSFNVYLNGYIVGSRVVRVYSFRTPIYAMEVSMKLIDSDKAITDFKRIK